MEGTSRRQRQSKVHKRPRERDMESRENRGERKKKTEQTQSNRGETLTVASFMESIFHEELSTR